MQALLEHERGRGRQGVAVDAKLVEPLEAANGVGEGGYSIVANVELHEREEEANGIGQSLKVVEVLADIQDFKLD